MPDRICVFPGSFDPPTLGHMDLIRRGASLFDVLIVAVLRNPKKLSAFSVQERLDFLRKCCENLSSVRVTSFEGLTADFYRQTGASCLLRGIRGAADCDSEILMAAANRSLCPDLETILLPCLPEHAHISSSLVREIAAFHGDLRGLVPQEILPSVLARWA